MLMQALQQFGQRIGQVMQSLSGVHEQSLYLSDLYEFLEIEAGEAEAPADPVAAGTGGESAASLVVGSSGGQGVREVPLGAGASDESPGPSMGGRLPTAAGIELVDVSIHISGGRAPGAPGRQPRDPPR